MEAIITQKGNATHIEFLEPISYSDMRLLLNSIQAKLRIKKMNVTWVIYDEDLSFNHSKSKKE